MQGPERTAGAARAKQVPTEELRRWIIAQAEVGTPPEEILSAMVGSGWQHDVAADALEATLRARLDEVAAERRWHEEHPQPDLPEPDVPEGAASWTFEGHTVRIVASMRRPRLFVFGELLSDAECDALRAAAEPRLARSETVQTDTGGSEVNAARTSDGMFFSRGESELITRIERRIGALLRWPVERGEGLQVLRYRPGAEYRPHHDYFDPAMPGAAAVLRRGGQRVATLVMYLASPEAGGATTFPDVGFEVAPVKGHAVFFAYERAHASTRTLHGGAPVLAGEKWVATKWLREGRFE